MATKIFIVSFEKNSKKKQTSYCRIFTSTLFPDIFLLEILSCPPSWMFVDIHDTS